MSRSRHTEAQMIAAALKQAEAEQWKIWLERRVQPHDLRLEGSFRSRVFSSRNLGLLQS